MNLLAARQLSWPAERWFGDRISQQICAHHRRRLRRIGWEHALDPPPGGWADGDLPVRDGNRAEVLIDGAEALPGIADGASRQRGRTCT